MPIHDTTTPLFDPVGGDPITVTADRDRFVILTSGPIATPDRLYLVPHVAMELADRLYTAAHQVLDARDTGGAA